MSNCGDLLADMKMMMITNHWLKIFPRETTFYYLSYDSKPDSYITSVDCIVWLLAIVLFTQKVHYIVVTVRYIEHHRSLQTLQVLFTVS